jgi:uncharacterized protein
MPAADNLYLLLDLDPTIDSLPIIEKRIQEKQREWSTLTGPNSHRTNAARQLVGKRKAEFLNPKDTKFRDEQAAEAKRILLERAQTNRRRLQDIMDLIKEDGFYTDTAVIKTAQRLDGTFSTAEIEAEFKKVGLKKSNTQPQVRPKRQRLDATTHSNITRGLVLLGLPDLYDFLESTSEESVQTLLRRTDDLSIELHRKGHTDAKATVRQELVGYCKQVFRNNVEKEKYNNSLAFQSMDQMAHLIDKAGDDGIINYSEYKILLNKAENYGVQPDLAREYILDYATEHHWTLVDETAIGKQTTTPFEIHTTYAASSRTRAAFSFLGSMYSTKDQLAEAFVSNWVDALGLWKTRNTELMNWLKHDLGHVDLARDLEKLFSQGGLNDDAALLCVIQLLSPKLTPTFKSFKLTKANLTALADKALSDPTAGETLCELYRAGIHKMDSVVPGLKWLASIGQTWQKSIAEYELLRRRLHHHAEVADLNDLRFTPSLLTLILATTTPDSFGVSVLRGIAIKAHTAEASESYWFADLGDPKAASSAALLIIPQVAAVAVAEITTQRAENARVARENQYKQFVAIFGHGAGVAAGIAAGMIVGIVTTFGLGVAASIAASIFGFIKGPEWVSGTTTNPNVPRLKGMAIASAGWILVIILLSTLPRSFSSVYVPSTSPQSAFQVTGAQIGVFEKLPDGQARIASETAAFSPPINNVGIKVQFTGAVPGRTVIALQVRSGGGQTISSCQNYTAPQTQGEFSCYWNSLSLANGSYAFWLIAGDRSFSYPFSVYTATYATSFDCARATTWAEKTICSSMDLAAKDQSLAALFQKRLGELPTTKREKFRSTQREWIHQREGCQGATDPIICLSNAYDIRLASLNSDTVPQAPDEIQSNENADATKIVSLVRSKMDACDTDASKESTEVYLLIIPLVSDKVEVAANNRIGTAGGTILIPSKDIIDGLRTNLIQLYNSPITLSILNPATNRITKSTIAGITRIALDPTVDKSIRMSFQTLTGSLNADWSRESFSVQQPGTCLWIGALIPD